MSILQRLLGRDDIRFGDRIYMRRWLLPWPWLRNIHPILDKVTRRLPGLRLHNIQMSDEDRALHCHPFDYCSIILKGGYFEHLTDGSHTWHGRGSILFRKAESLHRLELISYETYDVKAPGDGWIKKEEPAWTIVIRGPIRRTWGFATRDGWVPWRDFKPGSAS